MNSRYKKVLSILLLSMFFFSTKASAFEINDISGRLDLSCIDLKVIGVCVKPPGIPGIIIMYWEPALLIETVKQPGDTIISPLKPLIRDYAAQGIEKLMQAATGLKVPVSGGSSASKLDGTNLQFNEAHVYEFPFRDQIMSFIDMECPDKLPTGSFIKYLSELDSLEWRIAVAETLGPKSMALAAGALSCAAGTLSNDLCMGSWGAVYPRTGFITHQSQVVGSAAAAVRAVSIAGISGQGVHVVLEHLGFMPSFETDKLELVYPNPSGCIKIGQNPATWESGKLSLTGKYLWVYWRRRICCIF